MVSMEKIIAQQKRELTAQKQQESGKGVNKGSVSGQGYSSKDTGKGKEKEKWITIKKPVPQSKQATASKGASQSKKDKKRKVRESPEAPLATWPRLELIEGAMILPVSIVPTTDERLVIHPHPLFGTMIYFNKDAPCQVGLVPRC